jgi:hypothetical protein
MTGMVGGSGIEPLTFAMSTRRSPAELTALRSKSTRRPSVAYHLRYGLTTEHFRALRDDDEVVLAEPGVWPDRKQATRNSAKGGGGMGVRCRGRAR